MAKYAYVDDSSTNGTICSSTDMSDYKQSVAYPEVSMIIV